MRGFIKRFFCDRGYGFIAAEDGQSYFCHISNVDIPAGQYPMEDQEVSFDIVPRHKGAEAVEVKLM